MAKPLPVLNIPPAAAKAKTFEWEGILANLLGVPYSPNVKKFLDAWHTADNSNATNNPFNITVDYTDTATGSINSVGVKNFPTALAGLKATAAFIAKNTPNLLPYLTSGDFKGAADYLQNAHWAGSSATYGASVYRNYVNDAYTAGNNAPTNLSPKDKAEVSTYQGTVTAQVQANSPGFIAAKTDLSVTSSESVAAAEAALHVGDPWVTVVKNKTGKVTGFKPAIGYTAPSGTLLIGGQPATYSQAFGASGLWTNRYDQIFQSFAGHAATPAEQVKILESGITPYALQQQLAAKPTFTSSPIYKSDAAGYADQAKQMLGTAPPASLVRDAIAQNWDTDTFVARVRALPGYVKGPEYKAKEPAFTETYQQIYGTPPPETKAAIQAHIVNGWSPLEFGSKLRAMPQYAKSLEARETATQLVSALGLDLNPLARQPVASPIPDPINTEVNSSMTGGTRNA